MDVTLAPFYCARDSRIYVDPTLLEELANRSGDFAAAYVIAREVGRHVQVLVQAAQTDTGGTPAIEQQSTGMPMAPEMQADCYAGVCGRIPCESATTSSKAKRRMARPPQ